MEAEIAVRQLESGGFACAWKRVDSEAALRARARRVQARHHPFRFHAARIRRPVGARNRARGRARTRPFIFLSGTIGEERAIDALQRGAYDYVLKTNLARLVPSVRRALSDARSAASASRSNSNCATSSRPRRTGSGSTTATAIHVLQRLGAPTLGMRRRKFSAPMPRSTCIPRTWRRSISPCTRSAPTSAPPAICRRAGAIATAAIAGSSATCSRCWARAGRSPAFAAANAISRNGAGRKNTSAVSRAC